jgi:hypothetical protein
MTECNCSSASSNPVVQIASYIRTSKRARRSAQFTFERDCMEHTTVGMQCHLHEATRTLLVESTPVARRYNMYESSSIRLYCYFSAFAMVFVNRQELESSKL